MLNMDTMQLALIAIAFGSAISLAIEFLNRVQIRAFYAALSFLPGRQHGSSQPAGPSVMESVNIPRCAALSILLSALAYGSIIKSVACVIGMMIVIASYLGYVSWVEIKLLRGKNA